MSLARRAGGPGFTLVELLLALVLTALVSTVTAQIVVQSVQAGQRLNARQAEARRQAFPLERLAEDLQARIPGTESLAIALDANHRPRLEMISRIAEPGTAVFASRVPALVTYRLRRCESDGEHLEWIREARVRVRGVAPTTMTVARELTRVDLTLFDGQSWVRLTAETEPSDTPPLAMRLDCHWAGDRPATGRVYALMGPTDERDGRKRTR
jgi:prepilin-type N-terminal cleavage/methylation domain-containing protein